MGRDNINSNNLTKIKKIIGCVHGWSLETTAYDIRVQSGATARQKWLRKMMMVRAFSLTTLERHDSSLAMYICYMYAPWHYHHCTKAGGLHYLSDTPPAQDC